MTKKHVSTDQAPRPIGPYSQAVIAGGLMFVSGQIPIDPATNELIGGEIEAQTERVLENVVAILRQAKMGPDDVVKTTVYMNDLAEFPRMNEVYARYFGKEPPARSTIQAAGLPRGVKVEIDVVAAY